jgi:hypothetical protein
MLRVQINPPVEAHPRAGAPGEPSVFATSFTLSRRKVTTRYSATCRRKFRSRALYLRARGDAERSRTGREFALLDNYYCNGVLGGRPC